MKSQMRGNRVYQEPRGGAREDCNPITQGTVGPSETGISLIVLSLLGEADLKKKNLSEKKICY